MLVEVGGCGFDVLIGIILDFTRDIFSIQDSSCDAPPHQHVGFACGSGNILKTIWRASPISIR